MGYSIDSITDGCYEGTTCLINKFGIRDEEKLDIVEARITFARGSEWEQNPINNDFDFKHYKAIHRYLFEDLYDWAGEIRTVNLSKKGTQFADVNEIERMSKACFERLVDKNYFRNQSFDAFLNDIVDFYCVTNMLHPFREGNGRVQRLFIAQLIRFNGYDINFNDIDKDELMLATINAANGVTDHLKYVFRCHITNQNQDFGFEMTML